MTYADVHFFSSVLQRFLDPARDKKNQDDDHEDSKTAAWIISPVGTMRPIRECSEEEQYKDDENDRSKHDIAPTGSTWLSFS